MTGYNGNAWLQRHRDDYDGPCIPAEGATFRCPDCPRLLTRDWFLAIFGVEPEAYPQPVESRLRWAR